MLFLLFYFYFYILNILIIYKIMDYRKKYLKYKNKYLQIKNKLNGGMEMGEEDDNSEEEKNQTNH